VSGNGIGADAESFFEAGNNFFFGEGVRRIRELDLVAARHPKREGSQKQDS
jgi:hypothetical protein